MSKLYTLLSLVVMIAMVPLGSCGGQEAEQSANRQEPAAEEAEPAAEEAESILESTAEMESAETEGDETADSSGFKSVELKGFHLGWKVDGESLHVHLKTKTTGWVAVGFDPTNMMQDANLIIGYVKDGKLYARDDYGSGRVAHQPDIAGDGTSDIYDLAGAEKDGFTEFSFTMPMNSEDKRDRPLVEGKEYEIIMSRGPNGADDFTTRHSVRVSTKIKL
jgi:hypothetical protein